MAHPSRRRPPKADLMEELIASMQEAVRIIAGEVPPSRVHTAADLAVQAATRGQVGYT